MPRSSTQESAEAKRENWSALTGRPTPSYVCAVPRAGLAGLDESSAPERFYVGGAVSIVDRVKKITLQPIQEWRVIDAEPTSVGGLYLSYIMPLAALGPIASVVGWSIVGIRLPATGTYRSPISAAVWQAILQYVLSLAGVFVLALIIDALAPTFAGRQNRLQSLKVAAYSSTAAWLVGILGLVPALSILAPLGLYSLYPLYLGLPVLMRVPHERAFGYTLVVVMCAVLLFFLAGTRWTHMPG